MLFRTSGKEKLGLSMRANVELLPQKIKLYILTFLNYYELFAERSSLICSSITINILSITEFLIFSEIDYHR